MTTNYLIAQGFALIAFLISLTAYHRNKKEKILFSMVISDIFNILHYILLGAYSGCITKVIALLRDSFIIIKKKHKILSSIIFLILFIVIYVISGIFTYKGILSLFPIFAAIIYLVPIWNGNELTVKKSAFFCYFLWLIYNIYVFSIVGIISNIISIISTFIATINATKKKRRRKMNKLEKKQGTLYIVATPIGNLEDITMRAIRILQEVDIIAAEDTRHTLKLLNHLEISKPLISYHRHNEETKSETLIEKLKEGQNIALVSDAGTPGICDPGEEIIKRCIEEEIKIVPVPGACAMINSLICSGLDTKEFVFLGFLPLNKKLRKAKLEEIKSTHKTMIIYEAPHKLETTLKDLKQVLETDRKIVMAREITKIHEEFIREDIDNLIKRAKDIKGEIVLIIEGNTKIEEDNKLKELTLEEHYKFYEEKGMEKKEIIKQIAKDRNVSKNEIYKEFI